jgi:hypothetical protein
MNREAAPPPIRAATAIDGLPPALVAVGLTKRCGARLAVDHINCELPAGLVIGFVGPNGGFTFSSSSSPAKREGALSGRPVVKRHLSGGVR